MTTIEDRQVLRRRLLEAAYEANEEPGLGHMDYEDWAEANGVDKPDVEAAAHWLEGHGWVEYPSTGSQVAITVAGIDEIEAPSVTATPQSAAPSTSSATALALEQLTMEHFRQLEGVIAEIRQFLSDHREEMDEVDVRDLEAQAETIEVQKRSGRPRKGAVGSALTAAIHLANDTRTGIVGGASFAGAQRLLQALGF